MAGVFMECNRIEELLSEYMEASLPDQEMIQVETHLENCQNCSLLLDTMQSTLEQCRNYPVFEIDPSLTEKILLQTSRKPERRSIKKLWNNFLLKPLFTPQLAVGGGLAVLFLVLMGNLIIPRLSPALSGSSPSNVFRAMNRNLQQVYGEGLKAYNRKVQLEDQLSYLKSSMYGKLRFVIDRLDTSNGDIGPIKSDQQKEKDSKDKSSLLLL
jgi:hypothetical protein